MRESRTYGSVRGARSETRVPTATSRLAIYMNSAPSCDLRRHLTRTRRPELATRDINKVNVFGIVWAASIAI